MPLKLNVGASQKIGEAHYGSRGASINLELEVDSSLALDPPKLQERVRQLFSLVRQAVAEELNNGHAPSSQNGSTKQSSPPDPPANGKQNGKRLATSAQVKALYAIAKERGFDLRNLLRDRYSLDRPEEFTIQQASALIGSLKSSDE